jgi:cell division septation protein DedD
MSVPREVSPDHFPDLAPVLFSDHTVVALTPATSDLAWAARASLDAARAAARGGRAVGLVDLSLEQPALRSSTGEEGIVDALLFGVSLNHVAHREEATLHVIGVGSLPPNPVEVWGHERWPRLARGFRQEGALLLLFAPPSALPHLSAPLDGLVVLAPQGYRPDSPVFPGLADCLKGGVPLLAVVCQASPAREPAAARPSRPALAARSAWRPGRRVRLGATIAIPALVAGAAGAAALLWRGTRSSEPGGQAPGFAASPSAAAGRAAPSPAPSPAAPDLSAPEPAAGGVEPAAAGPTDSGDSLFYSVQVAAFSRAEQAVAFAERLARRTGAATVSPVRLGRQGVWFRVMGGALSSAGQADSLLRQLWSSRAVERSTGTILRTPLAYLVARAASPETAREAIEGIRRRGWAGYIVTAPGGEHRVLVGAFEDADQARVADSLLRLAGLEATLVQRVGKTP